MPIEKEKKEEINEEEKDRTQTKLNAPQVRYNGKILPQLLIIPDL